MVRIVFEKISLQKSLQLRYSNRIDSQDEMVLKGDLFVRILKVPKPFLFVFRLARVLIPFSGKRSTAIDMISNLYSNKVMITRTVCDFCGGWS